MDRRAFIAALGSAAAWPVVARGQERERTRRIGIFMPGAADNSEYQDRNAAFLQALAEKGWAVGRNARFDYRWGAGQIERYRAFAEELVALVRPVILPPGRAKLLTSPLPTGSVMLANTIGTLRVASCSALTVAVPLPRITSGPRATSSTAKAR